MSQIAHLAILSTSLYFCTRDSSQLKRPSMQRDNIQYIDTVLIILQNRDSSILTEQTILCKTESQIFLCPQKDVYYSRPSTHQATRIFHLAALLLSGIAYRVDHPCCARMPHLRCSCRRLCAEFLLRRPYLKSEPVSPAGTTNQNLISKWP